MRQIFCTFTLIFSFFISDAQQLAPTPPMGWMTWNFFGENINEQIIRDMADAMVNTGMVKAGYKFLMIDDGWQGGRDNKNFMVPDPKKFPAGMKALADYVHGKGIKIGIYSDAAQLTCAGYTASLGFENQDAKTFAGWGMDYLKYDYCHAPDDSVTAKTRYKTMADALRGSGRDIVFSICEWGGRFPWRWAANAGGQLWRTTGDVRDDWSSLIYILDANAELSKFAGLGHWNDPDMLIVGLRGNNGPASDLGSKGCTDTEYQTNMSLWAIMASPLIATNDLRNMNEATKNILLNPEIITINQDNLGKQAVRKIKNDTWNVFVKPLSNGDFAVAVLNRSNSKQNMTINFSELGLSDNYSIKDLWQHKTVGTGKDFSIMAESHETKVYRLSKSH